MLPFFPIDILSVIFTAVALPSFTHRLSIKSFVTNNRKTCPSFLMDLQGTHKCCESSDIYLIYLILLSYLQSIRPLYGLFLEIIKDHGSL